MVMEAKWETGRLRKRFAADERRGTPIKKQNACRGQSALICGLKVF